MSDKDAQPNTSPVAIDDEYKEAAQVVVDDRMRTDVLGPHFCKVLKDHKPVGEDIVKLIAEEIKAQPTLKDAIKSVIDEHSKETKIRWMDRFLGAGGTILISVIIWFLTNLASNS